LKRVSRPGLRRYVGAQEIPRVLGDGGIDSFHAARRPSDAKQKQNVGGELLAYVW
jgi:small subunit ribosomal protein S8